MPAGPVQGRALLARPTLVASLRIAGRRYLRVDSGLPYGFLGLSSLTLSTDPTTAENMETPTSLQATDRLGNQLPSSPTAQDIERQADQLRIIDDADLSTEVTDRIPLEDLERQRQQAAVLASGPIAD